MYYDHLVTIGNHLNKFSHRPTRGHTTLTNTLAKPKNTFWNLSAAKRERIEDVLVREFATNGYRKASLNSIAQNTGIAKGSLYQYFENKEMIFLFVFDRFTELVKRMVGQPACAGPPPASFWEAIRQVLVAGMAFIDSYPDYFQLYLNVLFEQDVPRREELIARVRLFSQEYFSPLIAAGQQDRRIRADISAGMIVFMIDAVLDRFLQGYARSYLAGGLRLCNKSSADLQHELNELLAVLRRGLEPLAEH